MRHNRHKLPELRFLKPLLITNCRLGTLRQQVQLRCRNAVVANTRIIHVVGLVEYHQRVLPGSLGWTPVEIANNNRLLVLTLSEGPLGIRDRRGSRLGSPVGH